MHHGQNGVDDVFEQPLLMLWSIGSSRWIRLDQLGTVAQEKIA